VTRCLHALEEKKAEAIRTLDVRGKSSLADFLLIATGNSDTHLRALRIAVEKELDAMHAIIVGRETQPDSGWCVVDAFDVIVHLFRRDQRDTYDLEKLWLNSPLRPLR
jgi:ribosome-associated protein